MASPNPPGQVENLHIVLPSGETFTRKAYSKYTKDELINIIQQCNNIKHILEVLKINKIYHYKLKEFIANNSISTEHFKKNYNYTTWNNKHIQSNSVFKKYLLNDGILINKCYICNMLPIWNNKQITLQLDHINGISTDNRHDNLRMLCPNCHSQTSTFTGRNVNTQVNNKINTIITPTISQPITVNTPITLQPIIKHIYTCKKCNIEITNKAKTGSCRVCYKEGIRIVTRPSYENLLKEINEIGYLQTGIKYGVSDNAVRKWVKNYLKLNPKPTI